MAEQKIKIVLQADGSKMLSTMKDGTRSLSDFRVATDKVTPSTSALKETMTAAAGKVANFATAMTGAASAGAAFVAFNANAIKEQASFADALGMSANALSGLQYALKDTALSGEKIGDILKDTSEKIGEAFATGGGEAAEALELLNLNAKNLVNLTPDQQLMKIAGALDEVGTQSEKIAITEMLASDMSLLLPALENGAEGLRAAQREAELLGVALSDIDSSMIAQASSDMGRLGGAAKGAGNILTAELAPAFGAVSGAIADTITKSGGLAPVIDNWGEAVIDASAFAVDAFDGINESVALVIQKYAEFIAFIADANYKYESIFGDKEDVREALQWQVEAHAAASKAIDERIKEQETDRKADFLKAVEERKRGYEIEAQYQQDLIALGFEENEAQVKINQTVNDGNQKLKERVKTGGDWLQMLDAQTAAFGDDPFAEPKAAAATGDWSSMLSAQTDEFADSAADANKLLEESLSLVNDFGDAWTQTGNQAIDAIGSMVSALSDVNQNEMDYAKQVAKIKEADFENEADRVKALQAIEELRIKNSVKGSKDMLAASVAMFEEGSKAQKAAHAIYQTVTAVELGLELQKQIALMTTGTTAVAASNVTTTAKTGKAVANATASVTAAGSGDPYTAPLRVVAMTAMMAATLANIGQSFGGGGLSQPTGMLGTATVGGRLGQSETDTYSLESSYERMLELETDQYHELKGISDGVRSLNDGIVSAVTGMYTTGFAESVNAGLYSSYGGLGEDFIDAAYIGPLIRLGGTIVDKIFGSGTVAKISNSIFGGKTTVYDPRLEFTGTVLEPDFWAEQTKKVDGGWFSSDKVSTIPIDLNTRLIKQFNQIFDSIEDTADAIGEQLGLTEQQIDAAVSDVDLAETLGEITLKGEDEEITKRLSEEFSMVADAVGYELAPDLIDKFAKLGETYFDTLTRVVTDKVVVEDIFKMSGQSVGTTQRVSGHTYTNSDGSSFERPINRDGFFDNVRIKFVFNEAGELIRSVSPIYETVAADIYEVSQSLVELAGGVGELRDAASDYFSEFFSEEEQFAKLTQDLNDQFSTVNAVLPETREGYRALVEAQNLGIESDRERYVTLLQLSDMADQYYDNLESSVADLESSVADLAGVSESTAQSLIALTNEVGLFTQEMDVVKREIQVATSDITKAVNTRQNEVNAVRATLTAVDDLILRRNQEAAGTQSLASIYDTLGYSSQATGLRLDQAKENLSVLGEYISDFSLDSIDSTADLKNFVDEVVETYGVASEQFTALDAAMPDFGALIEQWKTVEQNAAAAAAAAAQTKSLQQQAEEAALEAVADTIAGLNAEIDALKKAEKDRLKREEEARLAAQEAAKLEQLNAAQEARNEALEAEIDLLEGVVDALDSLNDALSDTIAELLGSTGPMTAMDYAQAQSELLAMSQMVQSGASITLEDISPYLDVVRNNSTEFYSSMAAFEADQRYTAGILQSILDVTGLEQIDTQNKLDAMQVPAFAEGGLHSGGLRLVGERGPELEFTGPSRIVSNTDTLKMMDNSRLEALVAKLIDKVEMLEEQAARTAINTEGSRDSLNRLTRGTPVYNIEVN